MENGESLSIKVNGQFVFSSCAIILKGTFSKTVCKSTTDKTELLDLRVRETTDVLSIYASMQISLWFVGSDVREEPEVYSLQRL